MRACDFNVKTGHMPMLDATWLFIISFTTIGNQLYVVFFLVLMINEEREMIKTGSII